MSKEEYDWRNWKIEEQIPAIEATTAAHQRAMSELQDLLEYGLAPSSDEDIDKTWEMVEKIGNEFMDMQKQALILVNEYKERLKSEQAQNEGRTS